MTSILGPKVEEVSKDNSNLFDLDEAQKLTQSDVAEMKRQGKVRGGRPGAGASNMLPMPWPARHACAGSCTVAVYEQGVAAPRAVRRRQRRAAQGATAPPPLPARAPPAGRCRDRAGAVPGEHHVRGQDGVCAREVQKEKGQEVCAAGRWAGACGRRRDSTPASGRRARDRGRGRAGACLRTRRPAWPCRQPGACLEAAWHTRTSPGSPCPGQPPTAAPHLTSNEPASPHPSSCAPTSNGCSHRRSRCGGPPGACCAKCCSRSHRRACGTCAPTHWRSCWRWPTRGLTAGCAAQPRRPPACRSALRLHARVLLARPAGALFAAAAALSWRG